jgi:hypothetical protein
MRRSVRLGAVGAGASLAVVAALTVPGWVSDTRNTPRDVPSPDGMATSAELIHGDFRAFSADSWWNTPVPADAPIHPRAADVLNYLATAREGGDCLMLAGAGNSSWGQPVYWASPGDPEYYVRLTTSLTPPPELESLRLPRDARAAATSDAAMTVFDLERGYVVALSGAEFNDAQSTWAAAGATVTYLDSNGLDARTGRSDEPRNRGSHRGNNGAVMMVRFDEVRRGAIRHVLKVAAGPETSRLAVFPMVGSDGKSRHPDAPPQGLRFRIKPSVDLDTLGLDEEALVIARALQTYGFYIGDSGNNTALKLENTRAEGRGQLWKLPADALCSLPLSSDVWDVLPEGYSPGE